MKITDKHLVSGTLICDQIKQVITFASDNIKRLSLYMQIAKVVFQELILIRSMRVSKMAILNGAFQLNPSIGNWIQSYKTVFFANKTQVFSGFFCY